MSVRTLQLSCFFITTLWSTVQGVCEIINRVDGCEYTVNCVGNPGSIYTSGCEDHPNVTFILQFSNVKTLSLGFFSRTNFDNRVRYFKAFGNTWDVIEPNAFKYYKKTIRMDLQENKIANIKNDAFSELVMMQSLNVSDNMIVDLDERSLSISLATQNSLEILDLSKNFLTSLGSKVLSNLDKLKLLLLNDNRIATIESNCFMTLRSLKYLTLDNNKITDLNGTLVAMSELIYLDLSRNQITKLTSIDMIRLISLLKFNASHNAVQSVESNCFHQAFRLQILDLSHNIIISPIAKQMFSYNSNLTYLYLNHNNISMLGDFAFKSTSIEELDIENNNITGDITNNTFLGIKDITSLNITHQHIKSLQNNSFTGMTKLKQLDLSCNDISSVEILSFENVSSLVVLNLSHNLIEDISFFKMFSSNLTDIYMNNNLISMVATNTFIEQSSLKTLDLSSNFITVIEPNAFSMHSIIFFNIKNNTLNGTLIDNVFSPARYLKKMDLSHHNLKAINESALVNLPLVESLDLSSNNIQYIDAHNFQGMDSLCVLDISNNNLTNFDIKGKLTGLNTLLLSNNSLSHIPNITKFVNALNLTTLDLSFNNISNATYFGFPLFSNLTTLNLSNNNITDFNNEFTNKLINLEELNLESNHIKDINLTYFTNIRSVNVSENNITYLYFSQFKNLGSLRLLDLRFNKIKDILPGTFQHLLSLNYLILSGNYLSNLRFGCFRGLNDTHIIDLSQNMITSINVDVFHECYQLEIIIIDYNNVSSIDVERLVEISPNLEWLSLGGNPIACEEIVRTHKKMNKVKVTSLHKIYHEDNVHGIKCGKQIENTSTRTKSTTVMPKTELTVKPDSEKSDSSSIVLVTWCSVLSVLLVLGLGFFYWRHRRITIQSDTRMQFQNNASSRNSECYNDLLS